MWAPLAPYFPDPTPHLPRLGRSPWHTHGPGSGGKGAAGSVVRLKTVRQPPKSWSAFYYHHMHTLLNNASGKMKYPSHPATPSRSGTDGPSAKVLAASHSANCPGRGLLPKAGQGAWPQAPRSPSEQRSLVKMLVPAPQAQLAQRAASCSQGSCQEQRFAIGSQAVRPLGPH